MDIMDNIILDNIIWIIWIIIPARTAPGGGGSFKDRKPIGEAGSCDAWMAEQSADGSKGGWSVGLSISLTMCLFYKLTYLLAF